MTNNISKKKSGNVLFFFRIFKFYYRADVIEAGREKRTIHNYNSQEQSVAVVTT